MNWRRINKLRKMSFTELKTRSVEVWDRVRERRSWQQSRKHDAQSPQDLSPELFDFHSLLRRCAELVPGCRAGELQAIQTNRRELMADLHETVSLAAASACSGKHPMLGFEFDLRGPIDWHKDPRSNYRWQQTFYADLPLYGLSDGVDVKYVWELGRHQFLVALAQSWALGNPKGGGEVQANAHRARQLILEWIEQNPLYEGVHWTSALEVAMRAISWIWTLASLHAWSGWQVDDLSRIARSMADHARYLERHFSFYASPYNHLIGEAAGLYLIGQVLEKDVRSQVWRERGCEVLREHGPKQFYADGFCVEQATGYHFYTLGFLTLAIAAARTAGDPLSTLEPIVHRAYRAALPFRQPDGRLPPIGDVDSARAIPVYRNDFWNFDSLFNLGAVLFDDPELVHGVQPGAELYWLMGSSGVSQWDRLLGVSQRKSTDSMNQHHNADGKDEIQLQLLKDAGYLIARQDGDWLLLDAGPIADGVFPDATPSAAHGHLDALQVLFWLQGNAILTDSGMASYAGDREWLQHFRGTAAHNTIEVLDAPIARHAGMLAWSHCAPVPSLAGCIANGVVVASGQQAVSADVTITRNLLFQPGVGLWIADLVVADQLRSVRWHWQLPTCGKLEKFRDFARHVCWKRENDPWQISSWSSHDLLSSECHAGESGSPAGWRATGYGVLRAGTTLTQEIRDTGRMAIVTFIGREAQAAQVTMGDMTIDCVAAEPIANLRPTSSVNFKSVTWKTFN